MTGPLRYRVEFLDFGDEEPRPFLDPEPEVLVRTLLLETIDETTVERLASALRLAYEQGRRFEKTGTGRPPRASSR